MTFPVSALFFVAAGALFLLAYRNNKAKLSVKSELALAFGIISFIFGSISFVFDEDVGIPYIWRAIIVIIGAVIIILVILRGRISNWLRSRKQDDTEISKSLESQKQRPNLKYGKIRVKKNSQNTFGGTINRSHYYIEITNSVPSTTAINCQGSITIGADNHLSIWEKNRLESINIAHSELLFLFDVSVFIKDTVRQTRLYLRWDDPNFNEQPMADYTNQIDRQLTVLIQSDNSDFPPLSDSFKKTIRQIINEAVDG